MIDAANKNQRLHEARQRLRGEGYHPSPKHGKGVWLHKDDCTVATLTWSDRFNVWETDYAVSRKLLKIA